LNQEDTLFHDKKTEKPPLVNKIGKEFDSAEKVVDKTVEKIDLFGREENKENPD
jgi:hypothetical protein